MTELERLRAVSDAHGLVLGLMAAAVPGMREVLALAAKSIDAVTLFGPLTEEQREALKQALLAIAIPGNDAADALQAALRQPPK